MNDISDKTASRKTIAEKRAALISELVELRKQRGLSQSQLSKILGISVPSISRLEGGSHNPTIDLLLRYAQAIDVQLTVDGRLPLPSADDVNYTYDTDNEQELLMVAEPRVDDYDASEILSEKTTYELRLYDRVLLVFTLETRNDSNWGPTTIDYVDSEGAHLLPPEFLGEEKDIYKWITRRNIPKNRQHYYRVLNALGLNERKIKAILDIGMALSLNDCYWVVPQGFKGKFADFNLYENSFSATLSLVAYTGTNEKKLRRFKSSPELSTNGMLPKAWRRLENEGIFLYKGGTSGAANTGLEPYSEFYAYQIAVKMGLDAIMYDLVKWKGMLASKCKLFTDIETSFVPIGKVVKFGDDLLVFEDHIKTLIHFYHKLGDGFENALRSMLVFDSIIYNTDRHYGNFGLLRENSTGEYLAPAPIFDNGLSLLCYAMKTDLKSFDSEYIRDDLCPVSAISFDEQYQKAAGKLQRQQVRRLINFEFTPHKRYNLDPERLDFLNKFVQHRVKTLLEL